MIRFDPIRSLALVALTAVAAPAAARGPDFITGLRRQADFQVLHDPSAPAAPYVRFHEQLNHDGGHRLPPRHELPGGILEASCAGEAMEVRLTNQLRDAGVLSVFEVPCDGTRTPSPEPANSLAAMFEGRTQVLVIGRTEAGERVLGPTVLRGGADAGDPIYFDVDTGPPGAPELEATSEAAFRSQNPGMVGDVHARRITFGPASIGAPLEVSIHGRVENCPVAGEPRRGEVGAVVLATVERSLPDAAPLRFLTFTGPTYVYPTLDGAEDPTSPDFGGVVGAAGAFALKTTWDREDLPDGVYRLKFWVRDVAGNAMNATVQPLVVEVVLARRGPKL